MGFGPPLAVATEPPLAPTAQLAALHPPDAAAAAAAASSASAPAADPAAELVTPEARYRVPRPEAPPKNLQFSEMGGVTSHGDLGLGADFDIDFSGLERTGSFNLGVTSGKRGSWGGWGGGSGSSAASAAAAAAAASDSNDPWAPTRLASRAPAAAPAWHCAPARSPHTTHTPTVCLGPPPPLSLSLSLSLSLCVDRRHARSAVERRLSSRPLSRAAAAAKGLSRPRLTWCHRRCHGRSQRLRRSTTCFATSTTSSRDSLAVGRTGPPTCSESAL
jgi:hypothetical protein